MALTRPKKSMLPGVASGRDLTHAKPRDLDEKFQKLDQGVGLVVVPFLTNLITLK